MVLRQPQDWPKNLQNVVNEWTDWKVSVFSSSSYLFSYFNFTTTAMTTSQIEAENTQMINDMYRLLKKYSGLRNLIRDLKVSLLLVFFYFIYDDVLR